MLRGRVLPVQYKKQGFLNPVSVSFFLLLAAGAYAGWEFIRVMWQGQEAYRILEETSSTFAGRASAYRKNTKEREALRHRMEQQLRLLGIDDPEAETWIDVEDNSAKFGLVYTASYHWPFDVLAPILRNVQIEHTVPLRS